MNKPVKVLYIDDYPLDRELVFDALKEHGGFLVTEASSRTDFEARLSEGDYDIVLSDFNILGFEGLQVLDAVHAKNPNVPVVIVTGTGSEEIAVEAMKRGAADYVIKAFKHIQRLPQTIHAALNKKMLEAERDRLFNYSIDLLCITGFDGFFKQLNPAWRKTTGWTEKELMSKPCIKFVHPDDRREFKLAGDRLINGGAVNSFENRCICRDGSFRWLSWNSYPLVKEQRIFSVGRDVTEHKLDETAKKLSEQSLKTFLNATSDMAYLKDADFRHIFANRALCDFFRETADGIIGKTDFDLMADIAAAEHCRESDKRALTEHKEVISEETIGEQYYETVKFPVILGENRIGIGGFIRDITERKRAEEELLRSEQRKTIMNMIAGIFLTASDEDMYEEVLTVVLQLLKSKYGLFGFIEENGDLVAPSMTEEILEICQVPDKSIVFPSSQWGHSLWAKAIKEKRSFYSTGPFNIPEGHMHIENFLTVPIIFGNEAIGLISVANSREGYNEEDMELLGEITGFISPILNARLQRDRQERVRKRVEEEQRNLQAQLNQTQRIESIGRLAGGVAHDFNNMLGVIIGHADLALTQKNLPQPIYNHLNEIEKAAKRSSDLTRQLLAFARRQSIAPVVLDLDETVEGILNMLRRLIGEEIDLAWLPGSEAWKVKMDPSQIDQILTNLCVNASDAIGGIGKITIQTQALSLNEDLCGEVPDIVPGDYILLGVSDNGCGMDRETIKKIFEPFFTTKEMGRGTGLGLSTVYGIVRQNCGFINVLSRPGEGTRFNIYLPRYIPVEEESPVERDEHIVKSSEAHETILVVEDDVSILKMTELMLKCQGYNVLTACTPGEAVNIAKEHADEIALLLTDIIMPEMDGWSLAKKLTSLYPGIKCLFMSGYTGDVIAHHGIIEKGMNFIQKPFSTRALAAKVMEVLKGK